uniref:Uncharacterized protein n=1 Tax=Lepeophtheirus salmonis TaxID=72036 RepID=A0A0K2UNI4_LEPSM
MGKHIIVPGERDLQPWQDMLTEDLVVDVRVDFSELDRYLAVVRRHEVLIAPLT